MRFSVFASSAVAAIVGFGSTLALIVAAANVLGATQGCALAACIGRRRGRRALGIGGLAVSGLLTAFASVARD